jgi:hypothetical protein
VTQALQIPPSVLWQTQSVLMLQSAHLGLHRWSKPRGVMTPLSENSTVFLTPLSENSAVFLTPLSENSAVLLTPLS